MMEKNHQAGQEAERNGTSNLLQHTLLLVLRAVGYDGEKVQMSL